MFDELKKYIKKGHFIFRPDDKLQLVCDAPKDSSGVYLIYELKKGKVDLIYVGISGREGDDGKIIHRKDGLRGRFLTRKQFGGLRKHTWPKQMLIENIEALDIYWYVTHNTGGCDFPRELEVKLLCKYMEMNGKLPRWNRKS